MLIGKYKTRGSAVRAARNACCKWLESDIYQAHEGPDYGIHPISPLETDDLWLLNRFAYELRGPALDAMKENTNARQETDRRTTTETP